MDQKAAVRRVVRTQRHFEAAERDREAARRERLQALTEARRAGVTLTALGDALGISRQRVAQLLRER